MKVLDPDLEDCLRRANPYVETYVEVSIPDAQQVIRRKDQFESPIAGTSAPVGGLTVGANGELKITPTVVAVANFAGAQSHFDLNGENEERRRKGLTWTVDPNFVRGLLRNVTAGITRYPVAGIFYLDLDWQLQIFRVTRTPGTREKLVKGTVQTSPFVQFTFTPLLSSPALLKAASIAWGAAAGDGGQSTTFNFDLSAFNIVLENTPGDATRPDYVGELPKYHFVITPIKHPKGTGYFRWLTDTASARDIANVGHFERVFWARETEDDQWVEAAQGDVPQAAINIENYAGTSVAQFALDMGKAPDILGGAVGRVVFERTLPIGAVATIELSVDFGATWTLYKHGDVVAVNQQTYRARVSLTAGAGGRSSPGVRGFGVEFRMPLDVSAECAVSWPTKEIAVPWLSGSIPEAKLKIVRTGIRDYDDVASQLGAKYSPTKLEVDIYLRSKHPAVTRDKWLLLERLSVTNRVPTATSEEFSLLSYLHRLKRNIPEKRESVASSHTVQGGTTAAQVVVAPIIPGVTANGNELDNKHFYIRVPATDRPEFVDGYVQDVAGNTSVDKLDFNPPLPGILNAGDVIELHSGIFGTAAIVWQDADPADVWYELLTTYAGVASERIGRGSLPRGGRPPTVFDRAPGDAITQAKCRVTFSAEEDEPVDELIDQVSFICGGATVEIGGQLCFVQIYPLFDALGKCTVPLPAIAHVFDPRDTGTPSTSPTLESRTTIVTGKYGVNAAAANKDAYPEKLTVGVDADAVAWLTQQSLESIGNSELPEKVSRWLYNSADAGLYLTTQVTGQVVRAGSTGLRVFGFNSIDQCPELDPGDVVVLITDQYTDYDPATSREIRGWIAVKGVLVKVAGGGKQFGMFVLGLADNVMALRGFKEGNLGVGEMTGLNNFRVIEDLTPSLTYPYGALTYAWERGLFVSEVWLAYHQFSEPFPANPWDIVKAEVLPLPPGIDQFTVPKPPEGSVVFFRVEPRSVDLAAGDVWNVVINAAPNQLPGIELDDYETTTIGTQWWKYSERGLAVVLVEVQTQIGIEAASPWGPPTRGPGDASVVRGGVLGPLEYEHDVVLDKARTSWIIPRHTLSNAAIHTVGVFGFDPGDDPNILLLDVKGSLLTVLGDTDVDSIRILNTASAWIWEVDGSVAANVDVTKPGTNGVAGLAAGTNAIFRIEARSDPISLVDAETLIATRDVNIGEATYVPPVGGATWQTPGIRLVAPTIGNSTLKIFLNASASPAGWTTRLWKSVDSGAFVEITDDVTPALGAPPVGETEYDLYTIYPAVHDPPRYQHTFVIKGELVDNLGVVRDTRSMNTSWMSSQP